jgi:hypothetical protein
MQAIEFKTILHNGTLTIPAEYSSQWEGKSIRVIVLDDAAPAPPSTETNPLESSVTSEGDLISSMDEPIESGSLFSRLKQIKISAPPDFSENLDAYLNGEKDV